MVREPKVFRSHPAAASRRNGDTSRRLPCGELRCVASCRNLLRCRAVPPRGSAPAGERRLRSGTKNGTAGTVPSKSTTNPANTTLARPAADDAAARNDILQSRSWQDTMQQFDDWLSNQVLYDDEEFGIFVHGSTPRIGRMTAVQLEVFLNYINAEKLAILNSDRALDVKDHQRKNSS